MLKQRTQKSGPHDATRILVDYFCFTVSVSEFFDHDITDEKAVYTADRIERKFMLRGLEFQERKGMYGYAYARWYDGIVYARGGNNTIYIQMSGTGCCTWETTHPGLAWERWIKQLQSTYATLHISRIDIACDTFGMLKLRTVQAFTRKRNYISRWKTYLIQEGSSEMAVIWGSSKSDFRLRIYDKTLEREVKGSIDADKVPKNWVRCEFSAAKEMEQLTPIYYCHPYSCWERGTNENQNKLIRRFCKKGKSMAGITPDHAEYRTLWMNNYPRRLLGWQRPADLMAAECAALGAKMPA